MREGLGVSRLRKKSKPSVCCFEATKRATSAPILGTDTAECRLTFGSLPGRRWRSPFNGGTFYRTIGSHRLARACNGCVDGSCGRISSVAGRAEAHRRRRVSREVRDARRLAAREAVGELVPGLEVFIFTHGQFSLIDALFWLVEQTGPADVTLSTWTAAAADLTTAAKMVERSKIRSLRFLVDRSFLTRQPEYCGEMRRLFGDRCIRTTRTHAKFATIRNEAWNLAVRTSMNLNTNPRLENFEVSDDPEFAAFLERVADEVFEVQAEGSFSGELPFLEPSIEVGYARFSRTAVSVGSKSGR
jgi:hypothetical protein